MPLSERKELYEQKVSWESSWREKCISTIYFNTHCRLFNSYLCHFCFVLFYLLQY